MTGLTPTEAAVIDLHEAGEKVGAIAQQLGISRVRAQSIVNTFRTDGLTGCDARYRLSMELSSKALLKALDAARGLA